MITYTRGDIVFECDRCGRELTTDTNWWGEAPTTLRSNAWKARKVGEDWTHWCMDCQNR